MFSLQRLLGNGDRFFDLLGAGANEARQSIRALVDLVNEPHNVQALDKSIASRKQEKQIHQEITALLCSTFMTPAGTRGHRSVVPRRYRESPRWR